MLPRFVVADPVPSAGTIYIQRYTDPTVAFYAFEDAMDQYELRLLTRRLDATLQVCLPR